MPEQLPKIPQPPSPVARSGAGDISERELSRERQNLQTTPPANRVQPAHPKKQLFSVPVSKFTAKSTPPSPNLARLRSCLDAYQGQTPKRPAKIGPKAVSMEDLTPTKRIRRERKNSVLVEDDNAGLDELEEQAAAKVFRFMLMTCWRRRREDIRCLRKTLESQVSCSERLRMQVSALKSLLDSDNAKVRLAMKELDRLKQLLRDRDAEKVVLEREKFALESDICAIEDRASEMSIGWRNCRNELENVRVAADRAVSAERAAAADARVQRDQALDRLSTLEDDLNAHEELLVSAEEEIAELKRNNDAKQQMLEQAVDKIRHEREAREKCATECALLRCRVDASDADTAGLKEVVHQLQEHIARLDHELRVTKEQLDWWPKSLTQMLGCARAWVRGSGGTLPTAAIWAMLPTRHGC